MIETPSRSMVTRLLDADRIEGPGAWIQWKGTQVCMDVYCSCGWVSRVDDGFAYYFRCPNCSKLWSIGASLRLHELTPEEVAIVEAESPNVIVTDTGDAEE